MFCPECGFENQKTSDFCGECGTSLAGAKVTLEYAAGQDVPVVELDDGMGLSRTGDILAAPAPRVAPRRMSAPRPKTARPQSLTPRPAHKSAVAPPSSRLIGRGWRATTLLVAVLCSVFLWAAKDAHAGGDSDAFMGCLLAGVLSAAGYGLVRSLCFRRWRSVCWLVLFLVAVIGTVRYGNWGPCRAPWQIATPQYPARQYPTAASEPLVVSGSLPAPASAYPGASAPYNPNYSAPCYPPADQTQRDYEEHVRQSEQQGHAAFKQHIEEQDAEAARKDEQYWRNAGPDYQHQADQAGRSADEHRQRAAEYGSQAGPWGTK